MMQRWAFFLLFMFSFSLTYGQEGCHASVSGIILSSDDKKPIPFANVALILSSDTTRGVSNGKGEFIFEGLCTGDYSLQISSVSYLKLEAEISLSSEEKYRKTFSLRQDVKVLDQVTVETDKVEEIASIERTEVSQAQLRQSAGESLGEVLQNITGVNILQTGPTIAKPIIHGLHSNRILILNNGIRQEGQQWGQEHAPEIDPFVASNLRLIKGAAAVKYGSDAMGGVILVNPSELPRQSGLSGKVNLLGASNNGLYASSALLEGGIKNLPGFGWRVQGTYKKAGDARTPDYRLTNTGMEEQNFSMGLGYHKNNVGAELFYSNFNTEIGILRSAHIGNLTDFERAIGAERPLFISDFSYDINNPYQAVNHQLLKANGHVDVENLGQLSVQYGFQVNDRKEFDIRRAGRSVIPALSLNLVTHTIDLDLDMVARGNWKWDVGASFMYQNNENDSETGVRPLIPDFENLTAGGHLIGRYILPNLEFEFGARYDYRYYLVKRFNRANELEKPEFNFNNLTGSLGIVSFLSNNWTLRSNLGTAWRAPNVNELYSEGLHHGAAALEEGNPLLSTEKAIKWLTTLEKQTERFSLNVSGYVNMINDYIFLRPEDVDLTIRGAFPVFRYRQTDAVFIGIDTDLNYKLSDSWRYSGRLALIYAEDRNTNAPLVNIPANQFQSDFSYMIPSSKLNNWELTFGVNLVQEQLNAPRVVTVNEILQANRSDVDLFGTDDSIFDLVSPPEGYALFNLSTAFGLPVRNQELQVDITVDNLLNTSYRSYLNRFRYYADEMGRNVSLKLSYSF